MTRISWAHALLAAPFMATMGGCTVRSSDATGTGGAAGMGGAAGTGGTVETGGAGGAPTGAGGSMNVDSGSGGSASTDDGGAIQTDGEVPNTSAIDDPCTGAEMTSNDDRDHATPYPLNGHAKGCLQSDGDDDFYQFAIPAEPAQGGFVQVQITNVAPTATVGFQIFAAHDDGEINAVHNAVGGGSSFAYFAAQPGATYRVSVARWLEGITMPSPYVFTALFLGVPDANEPNDDADHATSITVGTPVTGYFFEGTLDSSAPRPETWSDFFTLALSAAHVKIALEVPPDVSGEVVLLDANKSQIGGGHDAIEGSTVVLESDLTIAQKYYLNVHPYFIPGTNGLGSTVPTYFTKPYKLIVTQ